MGFSRLCLLGALLLAQVVADSADYDAYTKQYADRKAEDSADRERHVPAISETEARRAKEEPAAKEQSRPEAQRPAAADPAAAARDAHARAEDGIAKLRGLGEKLKANLHSKTFALTVAQGLRAKVREDFDSKRSDLNRHFDRALAGLDPESLAAANASEVERVAAAPKAIIKQLKDLNKAESREMRGALHDLSKAGKEKVKGLWKEAQMAAKQVHHSGMAAARAQRAAGVQEGVYERNEDRSEEASGRLMGRAEEAAERAEGLIERQSGKVEHHLERMMDEDGNAEGRALDALRERLHRALHLVEEARKNAKAKASHGAPTLLLSHGSASDLSGAPATQSAVGGYSGDKYSKQYAGDYTEGSRNGKFADYVERYAKDYSSYSRGPAEDYSKDRLADAKDYEERYAGDYERKYAPQGRHGQEYMDQYTQEPKQKAQRPASDAKEPSQAQPPASDAKEPSHAQRPASDAKEPRQSTREGHRDASTTLTELGAAIELAEDTPAEVAQSDQDKAAPSDHEHEAASANKERQAAPPRHEHEGKRAEPAQEAKPAEPAQEAKPAEPAQEAKPAEPAQEAKPAEPAQEAKPAEPARATRDPVEEAQAAMRYASSQAEARIAKLRGWNSDMEDQLHSHSFANTVAQGIQARVQADFDAQRKELNGHFDRALEVLASKAMATAKSSEVEKAVDDAKAVIAQLKLLGRAESKEMHRAMRTLGKSGKAKARSLWREARVAAAQVYHSGMAASRAQHKAGARERVYERIEGRTEEASERLREHAERAAEGAERNVERQTDQVEHHLEKMMDEARDKQSEALDALHERLRHARERLEEARRAAKKAVVAGEKANAGATKQGAPAAAFLAGGAWQDVQDLSSTLVAPFTCVAMLAAVTLLLVSRRYRRAAVIEQPLLA